MYFTRKVEKGFTLVELLVVIGVIAVLIAILLPVINASRRQATTAACLSNLRNLGQALAIYRVENRGSYPFAYYRANTAPTPAVNAAATDGGQNPADAQTYVWWSVLRGIMRGKGATMDNSIVLETGGLTTRFMAAFNCPAGLNRDAGCDFSGNSAVMIIKDNEQSPAFGHPVNWRIAKPAIDKSVPPDCAVLWDATEIAGLNPPFSAQYVASYFIDVQHYPDGMLSNPKKHRWRFRDVQVDPNDPLTGDSFAIDPGQNTEVNIDDINSIRKLAGNIRWRHGKNDQANFLFADGSAKTMPINRKAGSGWKGQVTRLMFRPKLPSGYRSVP